MTVPSGRKSSRSDVQALAVALDQIRRALRAAGWEQAERLAIPLTAPQVQTLMVLVEAHREGTDRLPLSELSRRLGLAHSTVSGIVARLTQRGLVERITRPADRRYSEVALEERVRAWVVKELPDIRAQRLDAALSRTDTTRRSAIIDAVRELAELLTHEPR